jgi:ribonucleoside-diphosphate reductase alpha chain
MALQYGVPLITLVDKFRHARFEPAGMTSNRDIPFAKSLIDYIFCWLGCQFIPGYAEANTPNRTGSAAENKNITTARQVVEKTRDLAQKIAQARAEVKVGEQAKADDTDDDDGCEDTIKPSRIVEIPNKAANRLAALTNDRTEALVTAGVPEKTDGETQSDAAVMQQFNYQFQHFQDDAPACDICGSITVRNGTCYKCFNCGNSMGCS